MIKILFLHDFGPKIAEKKFQKNPGEKILFLVLFFPNFFSVEIFHIKCRLRIQSFSALGQRVSEIWGGQTDRHIWHKNVQQWW